MEYQVLNMRANEIRLITLHAPNTLSGSDVDDPVCCTLDHFPLDDRFLSPAPNEGLSVSTRHTAAAKSEHDKNLLLQENVVPQNHYVWGSYMALSYAWGLPIMREIFVNKQSFQATENLEAALRALRCNATLTKRYKFWIDAICINQNDISERNRQVKRMQEIYSKANDVIVWLGNEADGSDKAMKFVNVLSGLWDIGRMDYFQSVLYNELNDGSQGIWKALTMLMKRP
jgi:hypothetical protein